MTFLLRCKDPQTVSSMRWMYTTAMSYVFWILMHDDGMQFYCKRIWNIFRSVLWKLPEDGTGLDMLVVYSMDDCFVDAPVISEQDCRSCMHDPK